MTLSLVFAVILITAMYLPKVVFVLLLINLALVIFLSASQIIIALLPRFKPKSKKLVSQPFVSILVPSYNEPPAILMQTIEKLSQMKYQDFEVLIIDNNTKDPNIWKPVKEFAATLGRRFHFMHINPLPGFKSGALNYALERVNPKSEYIAVIDADYLVQPDFLHNALSYFVDDKIALVQFPQAYRNTSEQNRPIADEYRHFFGIYMNMANHFDCVPSTGTVSVYKMKVLLEIDGFRKEALTEDADIGLRIYAAGYRGVYVDKPEGYGLMPYDLEGYRKQKWRWAFGNAQSVITLFTLVGKIPFKTWLGFFFHLTAWDHLHFLPFAVLGAYSILLIPVIPITPLHEQLLQLAALSIFITIIAKLFLFMVTLRKDKHFFLPACRAFIVHMGLTLIYSKAWLQCVFQKKSVFVRTNKFILKKVPSLLKNSIEELLLGIWFLVGAGEDLIWGKDKITALAFIVSALSLFSIYYIYRKISPTKSYAEKEILDLENKYKPFLLTSPSKEHK